MCYDVLGVIICLSQNFSCYSTKELLDISILIWYGKSSIWVFPKIGVPPNHPFVHRVFHYFHHPFWGVNTPIFGNTHMKQKINSMGQHYAPHLTSDLGIPVGPIFWRLLLRGQVVLRTCGCHDGHAIPRVLDGLDHRWYNENPWRYICNVMYSAFKEFLRRYLYCSSYPFSMINNRTVVGDKCGSSKPLDWVSHHFWRE